MLDLVRHEKNLAQFQKLVNTLNVPNLVERQVEVAKIRKKNALEKKEGASKVIQESINMIYVFPPPYPKGIT